MLSLMGAKPPVVHLLEHVEHLERAMLIGA